VSDATIWGIILSLGLITGLIRYSFLGLLRAREVPERVKDALGFVPVTVLPALVAPMVVFAPRSDALADPHRVLAGLVALAVAIATRSMLATVGTGMAAFLMLRALGL
jgi:branched-subunit amino acid transport protein